MSILTLSMVTRPTCIPAVPASATMTTTPTHAGCRAGTATTTLGSTATITMAHGVTAGTTLGMTHGITAIPAGMTHGIMATAAGTAGAIPIMAGTTGDGQEEDMYITEDTQERPTIGGMVHVDFQEMVMSQCMAVGPQMEIFGDIEEATVTALPQVNIEEMVLAHGAITVILDSEEPAHVVRMPITSLVPICHVVPLAEVQVPSEVVPSVALAVAEARSAGVEAVDPSEEEDNPHRDKRYIIGLNSTIR